MKRVLGKGLEALIPGAGASSSATAEKLETTRPNIVSNIPIDQIKPSPFQPRQIFDPARLAELAESIKERGMIQPVVVRARGDGYELIVGERRLRAVEQLGHATIPCLIVEEISNEEVMELALIENIQREDLNPIEEAHAYRRLLSEFGLAQNDLATRVGKDRSSIANALRLLTLPESIQQLIANGKISAGHARALLAIATDSEKMALAEKIISEGLSVRDIEKLVYSDKPRRRAGRNKTQSAQVGWLEEEMKKKLGTKVSIRVRGKGGRIMIEYYSNDELDRLLSFFDIRES